MLLDDRRESKDNTEIPDAVWMFEPPSKKYTHNIPDEPVCLWGFSASRTCLLPNMNYDEKDAIGETYANRLNVKDKKDAIGQTYANRLNKKDEKKNHDDMDLNIRGLLNLLMFALLFLYLCVSCTNTQQLLTVTMRY